MIRQIRRFIIENGMISRGDNVCIGLSGGADSVCLFLCLLELREDLGFTLEAFHLNHNLRGEESRLDESYVKKICEENGIHLRLYSMDVAAKAKKLHMGLEQAGHVLRKEIGEKCLREGCTKIALAHHKNDLAETFLFNIARGCSVSGLTGIRAVSGSVIRPLLMFSKAEIEEELTRRGVCWREDATNTDESYTRNFLRRTIVPAFEDRVNMRTVDHIYDLARDLERVEAILDERADDCFTKYVVQKEDRCIMDHSLIHENPLLISMVIRRCLRLVSGRNQDFARIHTEDVKALFYGQKGRKTDLPFELQAVSGYEGVVILGAEKNEPETGEVLFVPCKTLSVGGACIRSDVLPCSEKMKEEKNQYTKYFDYDIIKDNCVIRTRRPGDRIVIGSEGESKKLKEFFTDRKISTGDREKILLLAKGNTVHWVIGFRMGDSAKINAATKTALRIQVSGDYTDEYSDQ